MAHHDIMNTERARRRVIASHINTSSSSPSFTVTKVTVFEITLLLYFYLLLSLRR